MTDDARPMAGWSDAQVRSWAAQIALAGRVEVAEILRRWTAAQSEVDRLRCLLAAAGLDAA